MKQLNWQTKALALFIVATALWLITACVDDSVEEAKPADLTAKSTASIPTTANPTATTPEAATQMMLTPTVPTPTATATSTPTTVVPIPTATATSTPTTVVPTPTPTATSTPTTAVPTPTANLTRTPATVVPTPVKPTPTASPTPTATLEPMPVTTQTPTPESTQADTSLDNQGGCTTESPELTSRLNTTDEEYQSHSDNLLRASRVLSKYESLFWRQPNVYDVSKGFLRDGKGGWTKTVGITVWVTKKVDQGTLPPEDRISDSLENVSIQIVDEEPLPRATETSCDYSMCRVLLQKAEGSTADPIRLTSEYRHEVRLKYDPLFWRQPYVRGVSEGRLKDGRGGWLRTRGINVIVTTKVNQSTLPPEDRIPDCLEGIPVKITEDTTKYVIIGS